MGQAFLMGQSGGKVDFTKVKPVFIYEKNIRRNSGSGTNITPTNPFPQGYVGRVFLSHTAMGGSYSSLKFTHSDGTYSESSSTSSPRFFNKKGVGVNLTYENGNPTIEFDDGFVLHQITAMWATTNSNATDTFSTMTIVEV